MERDIITVYCLIDEYLKASGIKDDVRAEISNAEVLMIGYMAVENPYAYLRQGVDAYLRCAAEKCTGSQGEICVAYCR